MPIPPEKASSIRVALAGFGTVGASFARLPADESDRLARIVGARLTLDVILDRSHRTKGIPWLDSATRITDSLDEFLAMRTDVVVELIGGTDAADAIIKRGLEQKRAVITANKSLVSRYGQQYLALAREKGAYLGFEASVAGGIPILRSLSRSLLADRIIAVRGILNGTCNFILTEMSESGRGFGEVLAQAQSLGYAEADPTLDVSGRDAAEKLAILAALAFGRWTSPDAIPTTGISALDPVDFTYARRLNTTIRMLAAAEVDENRVRTRVSPFLVDERLPLANISGVLNAVEITASRLGSNVFSGAGAGGDPTAVSVMADVLNAALWRRGKAVFTGPPAWEPDNTGVEGSEERYPFYFRFFIKDRTGIIAELANILARHEINIDSVLQEIWQDRSRLPFIITVDPTTPANIDRALQEMAGLSFNQEPPLALPILRG